MFPPTSTAALVERAFIVDRCLHFFNKDCDAVSQSKLRAHAHFARRNERCKKFQQTPNERLPLRFNGKTKPSMINSSQR
jgi:hypothetical protein